MLKALLDFSQLTLLCLRLIIYLLGFAWNVLLSRPKFVVILLVGMFGLNLLLAGVIISERNQVRLISTPVQASLPATLSDFSVQSWKMSENELQQKQKYYQNLLDAGFTSQLIIHNLSVLRTIHN